MSKEETNQKPAEKTQDDKDKYLKPYWYPKETGEQNEILPSLKANVNRGSLLTKGIQFTINTILILIPVSILYKLYSIWYAHLNLENGFFTQENQCLIIIGFAFVTLLIAGVVYYFASKRRPVYLVDFACCWPDDELKVTHEFVNHIFKDSGLFVEDTIAFQCRLLPRTGLGNETYIPRPFHVLPIKTTMELSREECEIVMKNCCDQLFAQTKINPEKDIDIVICNCSLFNPTPSIAAMLMNMYKMKQTCKNYNLAGMGCSAGLVSIDLARDLLNVYPNINVLVFSTENITQNWYDGKM